MDLSEGERRVVVSSKGWFDEATPGSFRANPFLWLIVLAIFFGPFIYMAATGTTRCGDNMTWVTDGYGQSGENGHCEWTGP